MGGERRGHVLAWGRTRLQGGKGLATEQSAERGRPLNDFTELELSLQHTTQLRVR